MTLIWRWLWTTSDELYMSRTSAIKRLMQIEQAAIDQGQRKGVTVLYGKAGGKSLHERQAMRSQWGRIVRFGQKRASR